jgi:hypothetical protein
MRRIVSFILAILVGTAAGLAYGWLISPGRNSNLQADVLRIDYKADYVLMAAESYAGDKDIQTAAKRLAPLGVDTPASIAQQAVVWATKNGYAQTDLKLMTDLTAALKSPAPAKQATP